MAYTVDVSFGKAYKAIVLCIIYIENESKGFYFNVSYLSDKTVIITNQGRIIYSGVCKYTALQSMKGDPIKQMMVKLTVGSQAYAEDFRKNKDYHYSCQHVFEKTKLFDKAFVKIFNTT